MPGWPSAHATALRRSGCIGGSALSRRECALVGEHPLRSERDGLGKDAFAHSRIEAIVGHDVDLAAE